MSENENKYVSSRGILKSCNIRSMTPISSIKSLCNYNITNFDEIESPIIYVCSSALKHFSFTILPTLTKPFVLVSGDCDETIPYDIFSSETEFLNFIENKLIIHWFCQNWVGNHAKVTLIPIGLDYHTMSISNTEWGPVTSPCLQEKLLCEIKRKSKPFYERSPTCYSNFHFLMTTKYGYDRRDAIKKIKNDLVFYENKKIPRLNTWINQTNHAFVISPHGNGLDCHRTWEALALGCIPIVKTSPLNDLFKDLPVLIVNDWSDITKEKLEDTINMFKKQQFNYEKLNLNYWFSIIRNKIKLMPADGLGGTY